MEAKVAAPVKESIFSNYQIFIIAILSIVQFTVILDFMVLSPLGAQLMLELNITAAQFGLVVSAYAFSAGASGLLAAGFADKFDRKKLLLFFYSGFILGTLFCGLAPDYHFLLLARIVTGIFGGVMSAISFAIITDLFRLEVRGRVMGFVQMAFAASQVLGIPIGLYLANNLGWHAPFLMIVGLSLLSALAVMVYMRPVNEHLKLKSDSNAFQHLIKTLSCPAYLKAFAATTLLATGGFMLMPFSSAFSLHNLGISLDRLPLLYGITGVFSIVFGPLSGKLSDSLGKYKLFAIGSVITMAVVIFYTNMGISPFWLVVVINVFMFAGVTSRMISASALISGVPAPQDRGAFMGINSSVQQVSGGVASVVAGLIVSQTATGYLEHYDRLGYVVVTAMLITLGMMYLIHRQVKNSQGHAV